MVDLPPKPLLPEDDESRMVARPGDGGWNWFPPPCPALQRFYFCDRVHKSGFLSSPRCWSAFSLWGYGC